MVVMETGMSGLARRMDMFRQCWSVAFYSILASKGTGDGCAVRALRMREESCIWQISRESLRDSDRTCRARLSPAVVRQTHARVAHRANRVTSEAGVKNATVWLVRNAPFFWHGISPWSVLAAYLLWLTTKEGHTIWVSSFQDESYAMCE